MLQIEILKGVFYFLKKDFLKKLNLVSLCITNYVIITTSNRLSVNYEDLKSKSNKIKEKRWLIKM
ncbi:hypothetical protein HpCHC45_14220 [Helicobacter pylori]